MNENFRRVVTGVTYVDAFALRLNDVKSAVWDTFGSFVPQSHIKAQLLLVGGTNVTSSFS